MCVVSTCIEVHCNLKQAKHVATSVAYVSITVILTVTMVQGERIFFNFSK